MSKAGFIVSFDGPGVREGRIDVRDLAPALLSLGRLIDAANLAINGDKRPINVQAKAITVGSFQVHLEAVLQGWDYLKHLLDSSDVEEAKKLLEWLGLVGGSAGSLIVLYRWLDGRRPEKVVRTPEGMFSFELEGKTIQVSFEVMRLYQERAVNRSVGELLDTLRADAVDRIDFIEEGSPEAAPVVSLTREDRTAFTISEPAPEIVVDETRRLALSIRSLAFQEGNKWRLFDGQNVITATIEDQDFSHRVDLNLVRFAKGDILICEVRTIQTQRADGLHTEHAVLRVAEHRQAPAQISLPFAKE